jgi:acyl carrier protein
VSHKEVTTRIVKDCLREALSHNFSDTEIGNLQFKVSKEWDSVSHIRLMASLRTEFNIKFTFEDMIVMTNFEKILTVISKHQIDGISE